MCGVAKYQQRSEIGPQRGQSLGNQPADGKADDRGFFDAVMVKQRGEIVDVIGHRVRRRRRFGKPMAALVVAKHAVLFAETADDIVPYAEIGAERIGEHQHRPAGRAAYLVMQDNAVYAQKRHTGPPFRRTYYRVC